MSEALLLASKLLMTASFSLLRSTSLPWLSVRFLMLSTWLCIYRKSGHAMLPQFLFHSLSFAVRFKMHQSRVTATCVSVYAVLGGGKLEQFKRAKKCAYIYTNRLLHESARDVVAFRPYPYK